MALRARLTLMSALIVGVTLVLASLVAYAAVRSQQRGQVATDPPSQLAVCVEKPDCLDRALAAGPREAPTGGG